MHRIGLETYMKTRCLLKMASDIRSLSLNSDDGKCRTIKTNQDKENPRPMYIPEEVSLDEPPTSCCMSGCSNCVYILWAEALTKKMASSDPIIAEKILGNVQDPGMQAFLRMELRNLGLLK